MPLLDVEWLTRDRIRSEPDARFVFGDNTLRVGWGGQALEARGEPNSIGVATLISPECPFRDNDWSCWFWIHHDLGRVEDALKEGRTVYWPTAGIGTGIARLDINAPKILEHITIFKHEMERTFNAQPSASRAA